jgi:hypothetical protein
VRTGEGWRIKVLTLALGVLAVTLAIALGIFVAFAG